MTSSLPAAQRGAVRRLIGRFRTPRPYRRPFERAHDGRPRENPRLPGVSEVLLRAGPEVCRFPYASSETTWPPGGRSSHSHPHTGTVAGRSSAELCSARRTTGEVGWKGTTLRPRAISSRALVHDAPRGNGSSRKRLD